STLPPATHLDVDRREPAVTLRDDNDAAYSEANLKASTTRMGEMTAPAAGQGAKATSACCGTPSIQGSPQRCSRRRSRCRWHTRWRASKSPPGADLGNDGRAADFAAVSSAPMHGSSCWAGTARSRSWCTSGQDG